MCSGCVEHVRACVRACVCVYARVCAHEVCVSPEYSDRVECACVSDVCVSPNHTRTHTCNVCVCNRGMHESSTRRSLLTKWSVRV